MMGLLAQVLIGSTAAGAAGGSFTATAVLRGLREEQVTRGRSSCDHCGVTLTYAQTIPMLSYLVGRGACRDCHARIDPMHLWGEGAGALLGLSVGLTAVHGGFGLLATVCLVVLGYSLLALSLVDFRVQRIPNVLCAVVLAMAVMLSVVRGQAHLLEANVAWAVCSFAILALLRQSFRALRGEDGLGFGDVKLLGALAVWLGPATPYALILACLLALAARLVNRDLAGRAAFGPWIAMGAWVVGCLVEGVPWGA